MARLPSNRLKPRKKLPAMRYPLAQEIKYQRALYKLIRDMTRALKKHMLPKVPVWAKEATEVHLPTGQIKQDAEYKGWQQELIDALQAAFIDTTDAQSEALRQAVDISKATNEYNANEWRRLLRSAYGVDPTREDPARYETLLTQWADDNARLITNIPQKTMEQIRDQTVEALQTGETVTDLTSEIYDIMSERVDVSMSRARLIARDQVSKLNGNLTEERQTDLGVEGYIWRTVGDERVRETHQMVDGQFFRWDSPPSETDGNHPGEDYQCRCWAEPVLPEVVQFEASLQGGDGEVDLEEAA